MHKIVDLNQLLDVSLGFRSLEVYISFLNIILYLKLYKYELMINVSNTNKINFSRVNIIRGQIKTKK